MYLALCGSIVFFFQNCQEFATPPNTETKITELGRIRDWNKIALDQPNGLDDSTIVWNSETELIETWKQEGDVITDHKTCVVPDDILLKIKDLWAHASICKTEYILPPDSYTCMAAPVPYAHFSDLDSFVSLQKSVCLSDEIGLCEAVDQLELESLIRALWEQKDTLVCE